MSDVVKEQPGYKTRGISGPSQFLEMMAQGVRAAYHSGPIPSLAPSIPYPNIGIGYAVQETNTRVWLNEGRKLIGRKIAFANETVRQASAIGDSQLVFGMLYDDMLKEDGCRIKAESLIQPQISAEIGFRVARDVLTLPSSEEELFGCFDSCMPVLEISNSRIENERKMIIDVVADNGSAGLCVLGQNCDVPSVTKFKTLSVALLCNGVCVSKTDSAADIGMALTDLFVKMIAWGRPVRAGDIISSGAISPPLDIAAGSKIEAQFDCLGTVATNIS